MRDAAELLSVHFCSLIASFSLLLYHLLAPGGLLGSPRLAFSLVSLATSLGALLAPFLFLCPVELRFSPVKPFRHYLANAGLLTPQQQQQHSRTKRRRVPDANLLANGGTLVQALLVSTFLYVLVGTLLGADPLRQLRATVVWALLMTSLTSAPAVVLLNLDHNVWRRVLLDRLFVSPAERGLYVMVMSTLLGAWLGAIPIPLDWNRPWQVWPIPCACGAVLGSAVGSGYSFLAQQFSFFPAQLHLRSRWFSRHLHKTPTI